MVAPRRGKSNRGWCIGVGTLIGILLGCAFAVLYLRGFSSSDPEFRNRRIATSIQQVHSVSCESPERMKMLKSDIVSLSEKNAEMTRQVRELNEKLRWGEQGKDDTEKQVLVIGLKKIAGSFGNVKSLRTSPTVVPDVYVNPRLAKLLSQIAIRKELIVALANSHVREMLEVWFTNIKRVGIWNYLVVGLDDRIVDFCKPNDVPVYKRDPDVGIDSIA